VLHWEARSTRDIEGQSRSQSRVNPRFQPAMHCTSIRSQATTCFIDWLSKRLKVHGQPLIFNCISRPQHKWSHEIARPFTVYLMRPNISSAVRAPGVAALAPVAPAPAAAPPPPHRGAAAPPPAPLPLPEPTPAIPGALRAVETAAASPTSAPEPVSASLISGPARVDSAPVAPTPALVP